MDFISRQKRWEAEQARIAAESAAAPKEDEMAMESCLDENTGIVYASKSFAHADIV